MATVRLTERFAFSGGKVDRSGAYPVIRDVLLCGPKSANGRRYKREAFAGERVKRYEGKPVYLNHSDGRDGRKYQDKLGWVEKPRHREDGMPVGDIGINPKHPEAESVLWAAENRPDFAGMSHVAECSTSRDADGEVVEDVVEPDSVDIVVTPATTKGFYEQTRQTVKTTLRAVLESVRARLPAERQPAARKLLLLAEDDAALGGVMDAPVEEPAADVDPDEAITDAFKQALHAQVDALLNESHTLAEFLSKCRELYKSHSKIMGKAEPKGGEGGGEETPKESRPLPLKDVIAECKALSFAPSLEDAERLSRVPDAADRRALAEAMQKAAKFDEGERPRSAGRDQLRREEKRPDPVPVTVEGVKKRWQGN